MASLNHLAILCGSAPKGFRQKKLEDMYNFLTSEAGGVTAGNIVVFPSGVDELLLEGILNGLFDAAAEDGDGEVLLYFCALTMRDLYAELSGSVCGGVEAVRLGKDEIRRDVITYYEKQLAAMMDVRCRVVLEADDELISEESLGYEKIGQECAAF